MKSFKDKVVLLTGAGSGIGLATAEMFLEAGATVIGTMFTSKKSEFTGKAADYPGRCFTKRLNASDSNMVKKTVDDVISQFGRIDILINNAGIYEIGSVTETDEAMWDNMVLTNLKSVYLLCHNVIPYMQNQKEGVVVNVASRTGLQANERLACYSATKAAVIHLTKQMAVDYAKDNIRVNCVVPAMVETPMVERIFSDDPSAADRIKALYPMKRFANASEVADGILFLSSDCSSYMTGAELRLDGGRSVV